MHRAPAGKLAALGSPHSYLAAGRTQTSPDRVPSASRESPARSTGRRVDETHLSCQAESPMGVDIAMPDDARRRSLDCAIVA
ncbi:uncharacterized protein L969DRAFT_92583 [Mixia osmundae IAM 14324]|uniref:Uncharacterized protein n=1 Tax=Mixia osmundae (strain CBS 9802 / IAM 14324 / JCM 22182 / KY 12970) TaxID=764103 RepID=G7DXY9_MIXOS|nr:uncharacterized protein L969DRAFT_92583 [Mixia osmundae IAM 14324]KEI41350.1 hypothetical protein L969DRAFT_92583 [Mixia osmundae IAM 14324]GAA95449.1 hypothetical protein E5Q_02103 [Mixia osmundae IAM 14324]